MKNHIALIALFNLATAALVAVPTAGRAQNASTNVPHVVIPAPPGSTPMRTVFRGKVTAVDGNAKTFTVGPLIINVTRTTRIMKDGKLATFSDLAMDETVTGAYWQDAAGGLNAISIRIGDVGVNKQKAEEDQPPVISNEN